MWLKLLVLSTVSSQLDTKITRSHGSIGWSATKWVEPHQPDRAEVSRWTAVLSMMSWSLASTCQRRGIVAPTKKEEGMIDATGAIIDFGQEQCLKKSFWLKSQLFQTICEPFKPTWEKPATPLSGTDDSLRPPVSPRMDLPMSKVSDDLNFSIQVLSAVSATGAIPCQGGWWGLGSDGESAEHLRYNRYPWDKAGMNM